MASILKTLRSSIFQRRPSNRETGELYVNFAENQLGVIDASGNAQDLLPIRLFSAASGYDLNEIVWTNGALYQALKAIQPGPFDLTDWSQIHGIEQLQPTLDARYFLHASGARPATPIGGQIWVDRSASGQNQPYFFDATLGDWVELGRYVQGADFLMFKLAMTLHVSPTGVAQPNDPIAGDPFDNATNALNWVTHRFTVGLLTIQLAAGAYTEPGPVLIAPQSMGQLKFVGAGNTQTTITWPGDLGAYVSNFTVNNLHWVAESSAADAITVADIGIAAFEDAIISAGPNAGDISLVYCLWLKLRGTVVFENTNATPIKPMVQCERVRFEHSSSRVTLNSNAASGKVMEIKGPGLCDVQGGSRSLPFDTPGTAKTVTVKPGAALDAYFSPTHSD